MYYPKILFLLLLTTLASTSGVLAVGSDSEVFILDEDDTGGDLKLQFGTTLAEYLGWDDLSQTFYVSDDLQVDGDMTLEGGVLGLKEISTPPTAESGYGKLYADAVSDRLFFQTGSGATKVIPYTSDTTAVWTLLPMNNFSGETTDLTGHFRTEFSGLTVNHGKSFAVSNNHLFILVNSVTTGGDIIITGTTIDEVSGVPVTGDTETITVDTTANQYYQTDKKWLEVTSVNTASSTIVGIDYDLGIVGYTDVDNNNFQIEGYRIDAFSSSSEASIRIQFIKIQDEGNKKISLVYMEDIGFDADAVGNQVIDHLRTGASDRSYDPVGSSIWEANDNFTWKQGDFASFFTNGENKIEGKLKHEGLIIRLLSEGTENNSVDWVSLQVKYNASLE